MSGILPQSYTPDEMLGIASYVRYMADDLHTKDTLKATEHRLYSYPRMKRLLSQDKERIAKMERYFSPGNALARHSRPGEWLAPEEVTKAQRPEIEARIEKIQLKVDQVTNALAQIADDPHIVIIYLRYFEKESWRGISRVVHLCERQAQRHHKRLMEQLVERLYAQEAFPCCRE